MKEYKKGDCFMARLHAEREARREVAEGRIYKERFLRIWNVVMVRTYCLKYQTELPPNCQN